MPCCWLPTRQRLHSSGHTESAGRILPAGRGLATAIAGSGFVPKTTRRSPCFENTVGLYIPVPKVPGGPLAGLLNVVISPLLELPLNYILRVRAQGSPKLGAVLGAVGTAPVPAADANALLTPRLEDALHSCGRYSPPSAAIDLGPFVSASRETTTGRELLDSLLPSVQLGVGLYHNMYYDVEAIQDALAAHILDCDQKTAVEPNGQRVPVVLRAPSRPLDSVPWQCRRPYAIATLVLGLLCWFGVRDDVHNRFFPRLLSRIESPVKEDRFRAVDVLLGFGAAGESLLVDRMLAYAQRTGIHATERGRTIEAYQDAIFNRLKKSDNSDILVMMMREYPSRTVDERMLILNLFYSIGAKLRKPCNSSPFKSRVVTFPRKNARPRSMLWARSVLRPRPPYQRSIDWPMLREEGSSPRKRNSLPR